MKPTLASLFPNASQSCQDANPQLSATLTRQNGKTKLQGNVVRKKGKSNETHNRCQIPNSKPQSNQAPALGAAVQGKTEGLPRTTVRFTGYRVRPLDPDNFAGSCKDLLDGLRHAGLILGDEAWRIRLQTDQEKVSTYSEEQTVIEITDDG